MESLNLNKLKNTKSLLIFSIVLTVSLAFAYGIHLKNILDKALENSVHTELAENYTSNILYYDEVLTNAALMASITGNLQWEKHYRLAEIKLDNALKNAMLLDSTGQSSQNISEINKANYKLVVMENSVFDLVKNKKLPQAQTLINSDEYKKQKEIYAYELSSFIKLHEAETDKIQAQLQQEVKNSEWYFGILIFSLLILWVFTEYLLRKKHNEITNFNNRFNLVVKATNDCVYDWDLKTNKIWWNEALSNTYNYPLEITETDLDFWEEKIHPKDMEALLQSIQNVFDEKLENWSAEYRFKRADGSYATVFDRGFVEYDKAKNPVRWIGSIIDITETKKAKEEIKKSELKFRTLYESLNDAIFLVRNGIFLDCNSQTEKIFGCTKEDIIGYSPIDFSPEKQSDGRLSAEKAMQYINAALNGKPQNFEWTHCHLDKSLFCAEVSLNKIELDGEVFLQAIVRDVTQRKQAEEKIKMLALAVQNSWECIVITNENFVINYVNDAFLKTYGYKKDEIINQPIYVIHSAKNKPEVLEEILAQLEKKQSWQGEIINTAKGGRDFPVAISISPILNDEGKATSFVAIKKDITEQKKAEEKIKLLAQAIESAQDSICITEIDNTIKFVNKSLVALFGYSQEELIGQSIEILRSKNHINESADEIKQETTQNGSWQNEIIGIKKDGTEFPINFSASPVYDENGNLFSFIGIARDITEKKKQETEILNLNSSLEQKVKERTKQLNLLNSNLSLEIELRKQGEIELETAKVELELAIASKNDFFSRVSHELRTPLNGILGFAQLLEMGELDPRQKKGVNQVMKSGKQLLSLVNDVLELSKTESTSISTSLEPVQLYGILLETIEMCQPFAKENNIKLELEILKSENYYVLADYQKLTQVLLNLLTNAIKYNYQNGLVKVKMESILNEKVRISITDTGKGIAATEMSKLFKPFQRIETEITEMTGTGLGLAVTKKLIEAMNGTIGVESTAGKGSTFWIELPQIEGLLEVHNREIIFEAALSTTNNAITSTLLYIENNNANLQLVKQLIKTKRPSIKLITHILGNDAVKLALEYKPNAILLDLDLPDIHGSEVLKLLLKEPKTKAIPVIILSANDKDNQIKNLLNLGAKAYLTKPLDLLEFLKVLDEAINNE